MHKAPLMQKELGPANCLCCGRGNTPDNPDTMEDFWVLDLERDVNWGDPTYICKYCCEKIAALAGFVSGEQLDEAQEIIRKRNRVIHDLRSKLEARERRLETITKGLTVLKEEKQTRRKSSKAAA